MVENTHIGSTGIYNNSGLLSNSPSLWSPSFLRSDQKFGYLLILKRLTDEYIAERRMHVVKVVN